MKISSIFFLLFLSELAFGQLREPFQNLGFEEGRFDLVNDFRDVKSYLALPGWTVLNNSSSENSVYYNITFLGETINYVAIFGPEPPTRRSSMSLN